MGISIELPRRSANIDFCSPVVLHIPSVTEILGFILAEKEIPVNGGFSNSLRDM